MSHKKEMCMIDGCEKEAHSKGLCSTHYGQKWRSGRLKPVKKQKTKSATVEEMIRNYEKEKERTLTIYQNVVGFESRMVWRRKLDKIEADLGRLRKKQKV